MDEIALRNHYTIDGTEFGGVLLSVMAAQSQPGIALLIAGATAVWYGGRRAAWWIDCVLADVDDTTHKLPLAHQLLLPGPVRADIRDHGALHVRNALVTERTTNEIADLWSLFHAVAHGSETNNEDGTSSTAHAHVDAPVLDGAGLGKPLTLSMLAGADNLLVVGPKGSGKTTLLRRLIGLRSGYHCALDPHNAPGKWPCDVRGGGMAFGAIDQRLQGAFTQMVRRYEALDRGEATEATFQRARVTLVGDEWGAISDELPPTKERLGAGQVLKKLLAQGRKAAICVLAAAHSDTADSLGMHGNMALVQCFDYVVYLGAAATGTLKIPLAARRAAAHMSRPALAFDTERGVYHPLIDDTGADQHTAAPVMIRAGDQPDQSQVLLTSLLLENATPSRSVNAAEHRSLIARDDVSPSQSPELDDANAVSPRSAVLEEVVSIAEVAQIAVLLAQGNAPSTVAKQLPGYAAKRYAVFRAKVDKVLAAMNDQESGGPMVG